MLLLKNGDTLELITGSTGDIDIFASLVDLTTATGVVTPSSPATINVTTATTTTIVATPSAGDIRNVKGLTLCNETTTSNAVTVNKNDGTYAALVITCILLQNETLVLDENGLWHHYDATGAEYVGSPPTADRAAMEAGASLVTYVTPGMQHYHPSSAKWWINCGTTGNILASYNVTSITDTGTGVVTINLANAFLNTNWVCVASVMATATTWTVTNAREVHIRSATQTASVVALDCIDNTATTNVVKDPTQWYAVGYGVLA